MNTVDDETPNRNRQPDESDLGPEPEWLMDLDDDAPADSSVETGQEPAPEEAPRPEPEPSPATDEVTVFVPEQKVDPVQENSTSEFVATAEPRVVQSEAIEQPVAVKRTHPWMWAALPFVLLLATGIVAWFGGEQTLNGVTTWDALRSGQSPLFPARWAMTMWWIVLPLLAVFLIYGLLPAGREVTRIKITGPLVSAGLVATGLWVFAQHWNWQEIGLVSIVVAFVSTLVSYLLVTFGKGITNIRQRIFSVIPLSAALAYTLMLTILTWQDYSSQPLGDRGSSVLFVLFLVIVAAIFSFFLRDGLFGLVLAIWFAGVVHQQWGDDTAISLVAIVATLFCAALAVLGTILATESHKPSLTTSVTSNRTRTSFFRRSKDSPPEELS